MKACARLVIERDGERSVVATLRSAVPLTLMPARTRGQEAVVRLVNSAAGPLGGDELHLSVHVGAGARLVLASIAATVVLPGQHDEPSRSTVSFELAPGARVAHLPEPTVLTARASHHAMLRADLSGDAVLHTREVLVLGRDGETPGTLSTTTHATRDGAPLLHQRLDVGEAEVDASVASLAGHRVLATELVLDGSSPQPASDTWWSRTPLAAGGSLTTALADDTVTALRYLRAARSPR